MLWNKYWAANLFFILALFTLMGCEQPSSRTSLLAKPFDSTSQLSEHYLKQQNAMISFRARGKGKIEFVESSGRMKKEMLDRIDIFYKPSNKLYVNFDHFLQKKAIRFGSTGTEFWCWLAMSDINDYYYGNFDKLTVNCPLPYGLSPESVMEALGVIQLKSLEQGKLSRHENYNVLTIVDSADRPAKKYYIDVYDHLLKKIEHYDKYGRVAVVFDMDNYKRVTNGFDLRIPGIIIINSIENQMRITMNIKDLKHVEINERQASRLFNRPDPRSAKNVFKLNSDCSFKKMK